MGGDVMWREEGREGGTLLVMMGVLGHETLGGWCHVHLSREGLRGKWYVEGVLTKGPFVLWNRDKFAEMILTVGPILLVAYSMATLKC